MNCSRVLHAFAPPPQQSMDLAMQLCLSQSQPLYHLLSRSSLRSPKALRIPSKDTHRPDSPGYPFSSLSSSSSSSTPSSSPDSSLTSEPRSCLRRRGSGSIRKRVVFADARGLALVMVRLFVPESARSNVFGTLSRTRPHLRKPQLLCYPLSVAKPQVPTPPASSSLSATGKLRHYQLKLASVLPTVDFTLGLKDAQVQLESCSVTERGLMGTVRVACSSGGKERAVHVRVTFDSWRSHRDVPCILLLQRCGNTETDVFAFHLPLPRTLLDPNEGVEFRLFVRVQDGAGVKIHWDNNMGKNYRVVCMESEDSKQTHSRTAQPSALLPTFSSPTSSTSTSSTPSSSSSSALEMKNYIHPRSPWSGAAGSLTSSCRSASHLPTWEL